MNSAQPNQGLMSNSYDALSWRIFNLSDQDKTNILNRLEQSVDDPGKKLEIEFQLEDFDTCSCSDVFLIFRKINWLRKCGGEVTVRWVYQRDDINMLTAGEDFKDIFDLNVAFVPCR